MTQQSNNETGTLDGEIYSADEMRQLAATEKPKAPVANFYKKVLMYVTRERNGATELLVFEHRDHPAAGLQVPAGTIEPGEPAIDAAHRELMEESGLTGLAFQGRIHVYEWFNPETSNLHRRHVYHYRAPSDVPDACDHSVNSGAEDHGLVFRYRWISFADAQRHLAAGHGLSIGRLS